MVHGSSSGLRSALGRHPLRTSHLPCPPFVTTARVERATHLASRPGGADAIQESLGSPRGIHEPWRRDLPAEPAPLDLPVRVVWGDRDRTLPAKHLDAARAASPKAHTHLFTATGHMPQIERANVFADLALDFWA
ncbi:hypothetical protein [Streptomyces sp. NPDC008122]|uniref:hypothetical protein n=1 Tax=Streptomyces sp. NPDC008122 TaxID=3364810 RepID=UPI0036F0B2A4